MAALLKRGPLGVWAVLVVVGALLAVSRLEVRNPSTHWQPRRLAPASQLWQFARSQFGDHDVVLLGVRLPHSVGPEALEPFERWVGGLPEVATTVGPSLVGELERQPWARLLLGEQLSELRDGVLRGDVALLHAGLEPPADRDDLGAKAAFLHRLRGPGLETLPAGSELFVAGKPAADVALNALLRSDARTAAPRALVVMLLALGLLLGPRVLGPFVAAAAAAVVVAGGMAVVGVPVSTATVVTFPLTMVVGLAYGIHVEAAQMRTGSLEAARREMRWPLRWAFLTTAAGIVTFALSPLAGLRAYASTATAGLALSYLAATTLTPHLSPRRERPHRVLRALQRAVVRLFIVAARRRRALTVAWVTVAAVGVLGLFRLRVEPNNYLGFFPTGHPTLVAHQVLDSVFGGSLPMYVLAEASSGDAHRNPAVRQRLRAFLVAARRDPRVGPGMAPVVAPGPSARALQEWVQGVDPRYTRAVFTVPLLQTPALRDLLGFLDSLAVAHSDSTVRLQITGPLPAGLPLLESLVESQVESLAGVLMAVGVALIIVVRPWWRGVMLLVPNLLPALAVAAAMGYLGVPVDFGTVVVLSMVIGIAVDDTLQLASAAAASSPARGVRRVAEPVTVTSLAAITGFASFGLSPFPVTQRLGLLTALGLGVAWAADVTITPLLLARGRAGEKVR